MAVKHAAPKPPSAIQRKLSPVLIVLSVTSAAIAFIPGIGGTFSGFISHGIDRVTNGAKANDEMKRRAGYYQDQVRTTLGMAPGQSVNVRDFIEASRINPLLNEARRDVERTRNDENRGSMAVNAGVAAAGVVGAGALARGVADGSKLIRTGAKVAEAGKGLAGGMLGMGAAAVFNKPEVNAQEVMERLHNQMLAAEQKGVPMAQAVSPNLVFLLRVTQDAQLTQGIKKQFGKPFHKMNEAEQGVVMQSYPALANAAMSESRALAMGIIPPQELMAQKPNLNGGAAGFAQQRGGSMLDQVLARRQQAAPDPGMGPRG